ncbi:Hypothetical protein PACV_278 [Pacmanvirus A23]|uniref:HNH endonuclease n=1 Tax=Pacmanvirus A23 TaxID=1932881 RepID=UPI000A092EF2|nr:HNH endonuclease [Pacmanvirus A23]SIP85991.1 Hypothetical protein PACV_278 [Pacmanvirus A23]
MKSCKVCKIDKQIDDFGNEKRNKDGKKGECKSCEAIRKTNHYNANKDTYKLRAKNYGKSEKGKAAHKIRYENNKDVLNEKKKEHYNKNKDAILAKHKKYYEENKDKILKNQKEYTKQCQEINKNTEKGDKNKLTEEEKLAKKREYYHKNKEEHKIRYEKYYAEHKKEIYINSKERVKQWRENNEEKVKKYGNDYYNKNIEKVKMRANVWKENNKEQYSKWLNEYQKNKRATDPIYKISCNLRGRIYSAIKGGNKSESTIELLGCSIEEFKKYLETWFDDKMTWENYGSYWHIDHEKPCASFDLTDSEQQKICFNWSNMIPMEAKENMSKGAKIMIT